MLAKINDLKVYVMEEEEDHGGNEENIVSEEVYIDYETELALCTTKALKGLKHQAKRSSIKFQEFAKLCRLLFDTKMNDPIFMNDVSLNLGFDNATHFKDFVEAGKTSVKKRGRPMDGQDE